MTGILSDIFADQDVLENAMRNLLKQAASSREHATRETFELETMNYAKVLHCFTRLILYRERPKDPFIITVLNRYGSN
jgi:hypothetical protein